MRTSYQLTKTEAKAALKRLAKLDSSATYQTPYTLVGNALTARYIDDALEVYTDYFVNSTIEDCIVPAYTAYIAANKFTPFFDSAVGFTSKGALQALKLRVPYWRDNYLWVENR